MANLSDIVSAIDRLNERIGEPHAAAAAMQPERIQDQRIQSGQLPLMTSESIGISVAKHIGNIPALRNISVQLATIAATMKRTGPQSFPQQVLPVATPLPGTIPAPNRLPVQYRSGGGGGGGIGGRGGGGMVDSMRLLSSAFGSMPILGQAFRQYDFLHKLIGDDGASLGSLLGGPKTRAGTYRAWRDRMEPSPFAESAMKAFNNFGPGAIGNRLSKDWNVLSTYRAEKAGIAKKYAGNQAGKTAAMAVLEKAAMGAALDFTLLAGSVVAVGGAVVAFGKAISNANRSIAGYSPQMSLAYAISDIRDVFRDMRSAQVRAPYQTSFLKAETNFKDAIRPGLDALMNALEEAATKILQVATPVASVMSEVGGATVGGFWRAVGGLAGGIGGGILRGAGFVLGLPHGDEVGGGGIAGGKTTFSSASEFRETIKQAIAALHANTDALNKATGMSGAMTAAEFMGGIATAKLGIAHGVGGGGGRVGLMPTGHMDRHHAAIARMHADTPATHSLRVKDRGPTASELRATRARNRAIGPPTMHLDKDGLPDEA